MAKLDFYYDNKKVNEDIANWRDLEIEVSFDNDSGQGVVKTGAFEFTGALADKINTWNSKGMIGGPGIFEAPPFRISVCNSNQTVFDGGINTADCSASYSCDEVIAPLRSNAIDFMNDRAPSFSFPYLASLSAGQPGRITQSDYVLVPYVINTIPDYVNVMVAGLSLYTMIKEAREITEKTKALIEEIIGDTVMTATSLTPTVNVGTGMAIGRVLVDIIRITFYFLYLAFIIKVIISLLKMIKDNLIQNVKYKKGMRVIDLFRKACDYLGFTLSSTLLTAHKNDVIVPRKTQVFNNETIVQSLFGITDIKRKNYDDAQNPTSVGVPDETFADLILAEEQRLNAEVRIIGTTLHFETKDYLAKYAKYTLPNIQRKNADPHGTNACELASNYIISYALDEQDTNTYDEYTGTSCQMQLVPNVIFNKRNVLLKNLTEINLPYALAKRKEKLNAIEVVISIIYDTIKEIYDAVTGFLNGIINTINWALKIIATVTGGTAPQIPTINKLPPNPVIGRIGMMLLSSDFTGVNKILVIDSTGKLASNNAYLTAASTLIDTLHYTNFAIRTSTSTGVQKNDHNQWLTYKDKEIPFCCDDYLAILNNNYIKTYDQKTAKVKSVIWKPFLNIATINYNVKQQYTNNLSQKYIIDGKP